MKNVCDEVEENLFTKKAQKIIKIFPRQSNSSHLNYLQ